MNEKAGKGLGPQVTCPGKSWSEITVESIGKMDNEGSQNTVGPVLSWVRCLLMGKPLAPGISLLREGAVSRICLTK